MTGETVYNFGSGPGMMFPSVLRQAQAEMTDWQGSGISVWEMPFTGDAFQTIADQAKQDLRELLNIPSHFHILFMQGGASAQFSLVPLNLLPLQKQCNKPSADYIETGHWSRKAIAEGRRYCRINIAASGERSGFTQIPPQAQWQLDPDAAYCHITTNETANGLQHHRIPDTGGVPLVADMTSDFLSRPINFDRFGLVYAGAQKNIGPAGLTIVIAREDLIVEPLPATPSAFSYKVQHESNGRFNTPLTYGVYLAGLVFKHLKSMGGMSAIEARNERKSRRLYSVIDSNPFYRCPIDAEHRSMMNLCFTLADPGLDQQFLDQAKAQGLINLQGHPACGGVRASVYNAMPEPGVEALATFMQRFSEVYGSVC